MQKELPIGQTTSCIQAGTGLQMTIPHIVVTLLGLDSNSGLKWFGHSGLSDHGFEKAGKGGTKVQARSDSKSLRTYIPTEIVNMMGLEKGTVISWTVHEMRYVVIKKVE